MSYCIDDAIHIADSRGRQGVVEKCDSISKMNRAGVCDRFYAAIVVERRGKVPDLDGVVAPCVVAVGLYV